MINLHIGYTHLFYVWIIIIVAIFTNRSGLIEPKQTAKHHGTNLIETKECSWCLVDPMIKIKQNCKKKKTRDSCANKSTHITRAHTTLLSGLAGEYDALISQAWMCRYVPPFFSLSLSLDSRTNRLRLDPCKMIVYNSFRC